MDDRKLEARIQEYTELMVGLMASPVMMVVRGRRMLLTNRSSGFSPVDKVKIAALALRDAVATVGDDDLPNSGRMLEIAQELETFINSGPPSRIVTTDDRSIRPWTQVGP